MLEQKVYSSWAFSDNENEKAKINRKIYDKLKSAYKICRYPYIYNANTNQLEPINTDNFDLVIFRTPGYNHATYKIFKNNTSLAQNEIALICDDGNLCFGYTMEGKDFYIFED